MKENISEKNDTKKYHYNFNKEVIINQGSAPNIIKINIKKESIIILLIFSPLNYNYSLCLFL